MLAAIAAGGTFDDLAAAFGTRVVEGDLGHWLPKRKERA
jgi:aryl-alcohol dehydrogenase-like predicted oxidoreductase